MKIGVILFMFDYVISCLSLSTDLTTVEPTSSRTPPKGKSRPGSRSKAAQRESADLSRTARSRPGSSLARPSSSAGRPPSRHNNSFHKASRPRTAAEKAADIYG